MIHLSVESIRQIVLLSHVLFGMLCLFGGIWVFVDVLNVNAGNLARIRAMSRAVAVVMWLGFLLGGGWYLYQYAPDKRVILQGPWPASHNFFMETKEHLVIILLLLATFLPIAAANNLVESREARKLMLSVSALVAVLAFAADGMGGIIAMGVKLGLMPK